MRPSPLAARLPVQLAALACALAAPARALQSQILEVSANSLTTYLPSATTSVQGIRPLAMQRGVGIDGTLRAAPSHRWALAGNPFESAWRGSLAESGVRLDVGAYSPMDVDIALPAEIPWVIARTYNALQESATPAHIDSDGPQGANWMQCSQPEIVLHDPSGDTNDTLYLVYGADRYIEFVRTGESSNQYKAKNGAAGVFDFQAGSEGAADLWVWTDQVGHVTTFFGFNGGAGVAAGQIWKIVDPSWTGSAGNIAYVGDKSSASTAISNGFDGSGRITTAYDSSDRRFSYTYTTLDSVVRLTQVKAESKTGGTWSSPTGLSTVGQVDYTYYGNETDGDVGDLKVVTLTVRLNDETTPITQTKRKHYRYWEGTYNSSTNPGYPHQVRLVLDYEGARRYDWAGDSTFDQDFADLSGVSVDDLKPYAALYLEYASDRKVRSAWSNGECGCGGAGNGTHEYTYGANADYSDSSGYQQLWASRTVVERPDGTFLTQYFDETGQPLSRVITDGNPTGTPDTWVTQVERGTSGIVEKVRSPANNSAYYHDDVGGGTPKDAGTIESGSTGLVDHFDRVSSGDMTGFLAAHKHSDGTGTAYYDRSYVWTSKSRTITNGTVVRPLIQDQRVFPTAQSTETGYDETEYTYSSYTSDAFVIEMVQTELPIVTTGNNGPGGATGTVESRHFTKSGLVDFERHEFQVPDGASPADDTYTITYFEYADGQRTITVQDADTSDSGITTEPTSGPAAGVFTSDSGAVLAHKTTTTSYTKAGQMQLESPPGGQNVEAVYLTRLADHRLVRLEYNDYGSGVWYGPVQMTVTNQAGKVELRGLIALPGGGGDAENTTSVVQTSHIDETDADPITAVDTGSLVQMRTSTYDSSGTQLQSEQAYFAMPSSGAGTDGTHYDATLYGYDSMGRRWRTKEAHGTIRRTVFDLFGRAIESWIGTNDNSFSGGESSGTDNMVKTDASVFDGGTDGGNGLLTQRTAFVQDSSTDQRVTSYHHDWRGRVIWEEAPSAPYSVHKYDHQGRRIATGQYSSTSGLSATTDPTSTATNRLALSESAYDELGRVWKTTRHKIDPSDGSDDDTLLARTWYDRRGLVVKENNSSALRKVRHDRLGRVTDEFVLAVDNDSAWADVDDVEGDIVLEQHQTRYDATHDTVVMRVAIERLYSDVNLGSGETTGALDTNADTDDLLLTMSTTAGSSNVKGRPRITGYWYDRMKREKVRAEYGTYGLANFDRDGLSEPTASASDKLVTKTVYGTDGTVKEIVNPLGIVTRMEYDALGRRTKEIKNYVDGTPSGTDEDVTIRFEYTDGLRTKYIADLPSGQTDQETVYTHGTVKGTSAGESRIATGHLVRIVTYPDSSESSDVVTYAYNAQGQEVWKKDQATTSPAAGGNVIEIDYDTRGRQVARKVTTLGTGFDGAVRRIGTSYDSLGRTDRVTQYDAASSGTVLDEVKYSYDDWGNLAKFEQDRNSTVGAGGSVDDYEVAYTWEKATTGRNMLRRATLVLPTRTLTYKYRSRDGLHDLEASRVTDVLDGATALMVYSYNGVASVVGTDYSQPNVMSMQMSGTWNDFPDLDRWGRVTTSKWTKDLSTDVNFYHVDLTYDYGSNITSAEDQVHVGFDVKYAMDDVDRLVDAEEGTLSAGSITSRTRHQTWTLSHTGNWDEEKLDLDGDDNWNETDEHDDCRTHNAVNELTARNTDCDGGNEFALTYDPAGNMTDDGEHYEYEWDAFYRLRKVKRTDNQALVAEYRYNGLGYRIAVHEDTDTDGDVDGSDLWYFDAFDERWRQVARYRESDTNPKEEFVHHCAGNNGLGGSSYIDLVVCRNKDANTAWTSASDGTLEERVYYCQNQHADVSAIVSSAGGILEWAKYSAYGVPFGLPGGDADSDGDCDTADATQIQAWIDAPAYDVRGDLDLDGDVDAADKSIAQGAPYAGSIAGRMQLSSVVNSRRALAGSDALQENCLASRRRLLSHSLGRWLSRDPVKGQVRMSVLEALDSTPAVLVDPTGQAAASPQAPSGRAAAQTQSSPPTASIPWHGPLNDIEAGVWNGLTGAEQGCMIMAGVKAAATGTLLSWLMPDSKNDGTPNHMRHCTLSCMAAWCIGSIKADKFMTAHEQPHPDDPPLPPGQTHQPDGRDLLSNRIGLICNVFDDLDGPSTTFAEAWDNCFECCWINDPHYH